MGVWGEMGENVWRDFFYPYSASKDAARVIDQLPAGAVVFVNEEQRSAAVVPYLHNKIIYNPFAEAPVSYYDRSPDVNHNPVPLSDFESICKKMFPDSEGVYILCSQEDNGIIVSDDDAARLNLIWSSQMLYETAIQDEMFDVRYLAFE